jgi:hypothetical protein
MVLSRGESPSRRGLSLPLKTLSPVVSPTAWFSFNPDES